MSTKTKEFELLAGDGDVQYVEFDVEWEYSYTPARTNCRNDDACDAEEDSDIYIEDMEQLIANLNPSVAAENIALMYTQLERLAEELPEWAAEEYADYLDYQGEMQMEERKERGL